ncbi:MAG: nuclear transport factor 2 family protein [Bacteroidetes bacterium]|nr:MAG: nuclear transport factor 2 family protein [Bacteroidota bacterium]
MNKTKLILISTSLFFITQISFGQKKVSEAVIKELEAAEAKMFDAILKYDPVYWKDNVPNDYITINADGVMQTKGQILADSARKNLYAGVSVKLFDRKIRLYGDVAIINGRSQYLMGDKILGEVYHTEIWIKEKGEWMFDGWQGTYTKGTQTSFKPE